VFAAGTLAAIAPHLDDKERRGFQRLRLRASRKRRFHRAATQAEAGSQRFTCLLLALGRFRIGLELAAPIRRRPHSAREALGVNGRRLRKRGKRLREADAAAAPECALQRRNCAMRPSSLGRCFATRGQRLRRRALQAARNARISERHGGGGALVDELLATARNDIELSRAAGIVRGWTAAMSARELERLPKSWRQFAKAKAFWN
jgi:hypothetical protein